jgi:hypothetical protein
VCKGTILERIHALDLPNNPLDDIIDQVDKITSAEIPNKEVDPEGYAAVENFLMTNTKLTIDG